MLPEEPSRSEPDLSASGSSGTLGIAYSSPCFRASISAHCSRSRMSPGVTSSPWEICAMRDSSRLVLALFAIALFATRRDAAASSAATPPPYSLPWQLRPAAVGNVVRLDETLAFFELPGLGEGSTAVTTFTATYKLGARWSPSVRLAWVNNDPPGPAASGTAVANPLLGITYLRPLQGGKNASVFAGVALPMGQGGGDSPYPSAASAVARAIPARSAFDNALYAVNYATAIAGAGLARVAPHLTTQAEVTLFRLFHARGPATEDLARTNFTAGLHAGTFFGRGFRRGNPRYSFGADLRYQRWLTDAAPVRADGSARQTVTFAIGPRAHFKLGGRMVRPGIAYVRALDRPYSDQGYEMIQLDVPLAL